MGAIWRLVAARSASEPPRAAGRLLQSRTGAAAIAALGGGAPGVGGRAGQITVLPLMASMMAQLVTPLADSKPLVVAALQAYLSGEASTPQQVGLSLKPSEAESAET